MPPFFSPSSFWNLPLPPSPELHPDSPRWIDLLTHAQLTQHNASGLHINTDTWTIPLYEADPSTPRHRVAPKITECHIVPGFRIASRPYLHPDHPRGIHPSFGHAVPIPHDAAPDPEEDAHLCVIDRSPNHGSARVYDMWQLARRPDGSWATNSAIAYDLAGPGTFPPSTLATIHNGESVHFYGPCRAVGVPLLAGLITRDELLAGRIDHKLAFACSVSALERFLPPTIWTDGWLPGGIPAGSILQLDPALDLSPYHLPPGPLAIAHALQRFGAVLVDNAGGVTLYAERSNTPRCPSWSPHLSPTSLFPIPFSHYRLLHTGTPHKGGSHPVYHPSMVHQFNAHIKSHGTACLRDHD